MTDYRTHGIKRLPKSCTVVLRLFKLAMVSSDAGGGAFRLSYECAL